MKTKSSLCFAILLCALLKTQLTFSQALTGYAFKIVNMIPNAQSNETNFDSETNIAVNPLNTSVIAGSAFTPNPTGSTGSAPIYITGNGGTTWALNNIVPSGNGMTGDISLGFGATSGMLYTGILRGGSSLRSMILRTNTPAVGTTMTTLIDRSTVQTDQPWVTATTANDVSAIPRDRVYTGVNFYGNRISNGGNGKTAQVMLSNDATSAVPAGFVNRTVEARTTFEQDMPAVRTAIHNSGVVYAIYYKWNSGSIPSLQCDVIVVRDDNFGTGSTPFLALNDAGDGLTGQRVVTNRLVPAFGVSLGNNRLVASNLSIAVDPNNSANVFIAWCDRVSTSDYTVHFRRSTNSGQTWSADLLTVTNATNPGIAVTTNGKLGLIYQQLTGSGSTSRWETHFRLSGLTGSSFTDDILSTFLNSDLSGSPISPSLGDYLDIQAVSTRFYGVFPASNRPVSTNFPRSVTYQRNANFTTNQIRNLANTSNIAVSVDPFYFRIAPTIINICTLHPGICDLVFIDKFRIKIPPYPCLNCPPDPCLSCPYEFPFEKIYETLINPQDKIILTNPYFHLLLTGFDPLNFDIKITTRDGEPISQELNKTEKGYMLSFRPAKANFTTQKGIQGLDLMVLPKNKEAVKSGAEFSYQLQASDYRFKEFNSKQK